MNIASNQSTLPANSCPDMAYQKRELVSLTVLQYNENCLNDCVLTYFQMENSAYF